MISENKRTRRAFQSVELAENLSLEGAGDCICDSYRSHFWMGFGPRSDCAAADVVADQFGVDCIAGTRRPKLLPPRYGILPASVRDIIYYPAAFTPAAHGVIEGRVASPPSASSSTGLTP